MTDPTPRPDADVPTPVPDPDEPVVDLDATTERTGDDQTAEDKYIKVVDGRPETLGFEEQSGPQT